MEIKKFMKGNVSRKKFPALIKSMSDKELDLFFILVRKSQYLEYNRYLIKEGKHLDIGSGDGLTSLYIKMQNPNMSVDMLDLRKDDLQKAVSKRMEEDKLFNHFIYKAEERFPFKSKYFNSISLFYVLHHCNNKKEILKVLEEAKRVLIEKGNIIVIEETAENKYEKEMLEKVDNAVNSRLNKGLKKVDESVSFLREKELLDLFNQTGLRVIKSIRPRFKQKLFPRKIYILKSK